MTVSWKRVGTHGKMSDLSEIKTDKWQNLAKVLDIVKFMYRYEKKLRRQVMMKAKLLLLPTRHDSAKEWPIYVIVYYLSFSSAW